MLFFVGHHAFVVSFEGRVGLRFDLREIHSGRLARGHAAVRAGIQLEFVDQVMHGPGIGVAEDDCMPGSRQVDKLVVYGPAHLIWGAVAHIAAVRPISVAVVPLQMKEITKTFAVVVPVAKVPAV